MNTTNEKRTYLSPAARVMDMDTEGMLCTSGSVYDLRYGQRGMAGYNYFNGQEDEEF